MARLVSKKSLESAGKPVSSSLEKIVAKLVSLPLVKPVAKLVAGAT